MHSNFDFLQAAVNYAPHVNSLTKFTPSVLLHVDHDGPEEVVFEAVGSADCLTSDAKRHELIHEARSRAKSFAAVRVALVSKAWATPATSADPALINLKHAYEAQMLPLVASPNGERPQAVSIVMESLDGMRLGTLHELVRRPDGTEILGRCLDPNGYTRLEAATRFFSPSAFAEIPAWGERGRSRKEFPWNALRTQLRQVELN